MTNEQIFQILKQHIFEVAPDLEETNITPQDSLKHLGIDSINRAEIIMMLMDDLSLNVPKREFAGAKNIEELVNLFATKLNS